MRAIKMKLLAKRFWLLGVVFAACSGGAFAQDATPASEAEVFTDWRVSCAQEQPCRMSQTVVQPATARAIVQMKVFKGDDPTLLVSFPLGILLSPGWRYRIDGGRERVLPFEICDASGCHAGIKLTPDLLNSMKRGIEMRITFYDAARAAVEPTISLAGFTKAWEVLE
jgi:invasion protein IalB